MCNQPTSHQPTKVFSITPTLPLPHCHIFVTLPICKSWESSRPKRLGTMECECWSIAAMKVLLLKWIIIHVGSTLTTTPSWTMLANMWIRLVCSYSIATLPHSLQIYHSLVRHWTYRVLKCWHHKNDFSEIVGFIRLFSSTYLKIFHTKKMTL